MFVELIEKLFMCLKGSKQVKKNPAGLNRVSNKTNVKYNTPVLEFNNKNVVYPDNKTEKEIEALYSEIRELQAKNREKINKKRFVNCL